MKDLVITDRAVKVSKLIEMLTDLDSDSYVLLNIHDPKERGAGISFYMTKMFTGVEHGNRKCIILSASEDWKEAFDEIER